MKAVVGLGNPGQDYDESRHNVGWWVVDRLAYDWGFPTFERRGPALVSDGVVGEHAVRLLKPNTYMNRSGAAVAVLARDEEIDVAGDLLVVVDDANLDVGRVRFRPGGGAGGHNGLRSVTGALGTDEYARLRIGVGQCPPGVDLSDWVLSPMPPEEEDVVVGLLPDLGEAVRCWMEQGVQAAMNAYNR